LGQTNAIAGGKSPYLLFPLDRDPDVRNFVKELHYEWLEALSFDSNLRTASLIGPRFTLIVSHAVRSKNVRHKNKPTAPMVVYQGLVIIPARSQ
jgi:hypothetical protein